MDYFANLLSMLNNFVWGPPLLILLILVGIFLTIRTKGLQFQYLLYAHKLAFSKSDGNAQGDISHFEALMTALAATIGIGSITGVATAVAIGGVGSIFWMWIAAAVGMATKYGEAILAIQHREIDTANEMCGGPMYYIEKGLGCKWLAVLFAIFGIFASFGIGNMVQANSVSEALESFFNVNPLLSGFILFFAVAFSIIGGIKSIGKIVGILVPAMACFYIACGLIIIAIKITSVPSAFILIFKSAFSGQSATGGFAGASIMMAVQYGISRGVFSSEAGLGSSPIAAAAAKTDTPGRQALVSMCSVFITTGIVCTITGLVIALSGVLGEVGPDSKPLNGSPLALSAFERIIPYGGYVVAISLVPFAYSTILGWAYYGEKCIEYLFGRQKVKIYRVFFTLLVLPGSVLGLNIVWDFSNMMNGLMAYPNLVALFLLSGSIAKETDVFREILRKEKKEKIT